MKIYQIVLIVLIIISTSCVRNKNSQPVANQMPSSEKVFEVVEVVQTSNYTYLRVYENFAERWVAVSRMEAKKGDKYYYDSALLMNNFHSKELDRNFETVYFINKVSTSSLSAQPQTAQMPAGHSGKAKTTENSNISIEKTSDEITVAQVFENRADYANKEIEIRGVVVKVNKQVMGKNWIHIQDGSNLNGNFDLTITSQDLPEINDEVTFKGTIILNKDFGAGYFYEVIMENSAMTNQQKAVIQL
jgi:hypothetical protein